MASSVDLTKYRRYGRWIKRALILLAVYLIVGYLFLGISPKKALLNPGPALSQYRGLLVYMIFISMIIVIQFVAMFWYMARGAYYTIYPNEYDTTFDDVRGQKAAVHSTKEVL